MPKMQLNCPNCRQPIVADIEQLFDVGEDPQAKQRLLSGMTNIAQCPHCGYEGSLATPIVYHDPDKELLLTFLPPELSMPRQEQEKIIGSMINRVMDRLPQEKRKAYLLRPQAALTFQGLIERILEADGITKEMIQAQQDRLNLLRNLLTASQESRMELIESKGDLVDGDLFNLLARLGETAAASGDQTSANQLRDVQDFLLEHSTYGRQLKEQVAEVETVAKELRKLGGELDREKLIDLIVKSPNEARVQAYAQMARPLMDYSFFQMLTEKIDRARGKGRKRLIDIREKLLELTRELDQQVEARSRISQENLNAILREDDVTQVMQQNLAVVDEFFIQALESRLDQARKSGDLEESSKLQQIYEVIRNASTPPPEISFIDDLIALADDEDALSAALDNRKNEITPQLVEILTNLIAQLQTSGEQDDGDDGEEQRELYDRVQKLYSAVLRYSMERTFKG